MRLSERLLVLVLKDELLEEILGDLEEYRDQIQGLPSWKRSAFYWFQFINFFRPFAIKIMKNRITTQLHLYKNYYKTSLRSMMRNPLSTFINVFGLAVALGVCIWIYTFIQHDLRLDTHHENAHKIYFTTFFMDREGETHQYGMSPLPLVQTLSGDVSGITRFCRIEDGEAVVKFEDRVFHERLRFVDADFLQMLTFPLKAGDDAALEDPNAVILSFDTYQKYFGHDEAVGKQVLIKFEGGRQKLFTVRGVAEQFPVAHQVSFDFLVPFSNLELARAGFRENDWSEFITAAMIEVPDPDAIATIQAQANTYRDRQNEVQKDWAIDQFMMERMEGFHLRARGIKNSIIYDRYYEGRVSLPVVALMMLVLACLNYINIAIVSAARRLKEIGMRKVIGANRTKIIFQFLAENILVTFLALVLGIVIAMVLLLPWFRGMTGLPIYLELMDVQLWMFLLMVLLVTGFVSGIYPSFYISRFDVIQIFKGSVKFGKKNLLTKVFLGLQLVFACIGVTAAVMFTQNSNYQRERGWGYDQQGVIYTAVPDESAYDRLALNMGQQPEVQAIVGSQHHLGESSDKIVLHLPDREFEVRRLAVGAEYLEAMKVPVLEGREFVEDRASDKTGIIVNQHLLEVLEWSDPIGKTLKIDSTQYVVIGLVKNFHFNNFYYDMEPIVFTLANDEDFRYLNMRVTRGTEHTVYASLRKHWTTLFPEEPFLGGHQSDIWVNFYEDLEVMEEYNNVIASIAVILASLGLYGLITLNVSGRSKEFSIRKALGARLANLATVLTRQYLVLAGISLLIGAPASYFLIKANIDMMFPDPRPMEVRGVIIATVILMVILIAVMSTQIQKLAKSNPAEGLRVE